MNISQMEAANYHPCYNNEELKDIKVSLESIKKNNIIVSIPKESDGTISINIVNEDLIIHFNHYFLDEYEKKVNQ